MILSPEVVDSYKHVLNNPSIFGFDFKPFADCFEVSETCTPKHILAADYTKYIDKPLHKLILYIIIDEQLGLCNGKAVTGEAAYFLKLNTDPGYKSQLATPEKGTFRGLCNRTACSNVQSQWHNQSTRAYYCTSCAEQINKVNPESHEIYGGPLCILKNSIEASNG